MEERQQNDNEIPKKKRKWWRILLVIFLVILLLPILLSLLLQLKPVQNFALGQATEYYSDKFDGEIKIGEIDLDYKYGLDLQDFRITDGKDTVLSADALEVNLASNLMSLVDNSLQLNDIHLSKPKVSIITQKGEDKSNLDLILDKLLPKKTKDKTTAPKKSSKSKKEFDFAVKQISFDDLDVEIIDRNKSEESYYRASSGLVDIETLSKDKIVINAVELVKPYVEIKKSARRSKNKSKNTSNPNSRIIVVNKATIQQGRFRFNDYTKEIKPNDEFDNNHLNVVLNLNAKGVNIDGDDISVSRIQKLNLKEKTFDIKSLTGRNFKVSKKGVHLPNFNLRTSNSQIGEKLMMSFESYDDFKDFAEKVYLDADLEKSKVSLQDIAFFVPTIKKDGWYKRSASSPIAVEGKISGYVNKFQANQLDININEEVKLVGDFGAENIASKNPYLDVKVQYLNTSIDRLKGMLPELGKMQNIDKLGVIDFKGSFKGRLNDFYANGALETSLGSADLDMSLVTGATPEDATYNGKLNLKSFDLKTFLSNDLYGIVTINADVKNGKGLTVNSMSVDVKGVAETFDFKNHRYKDFNLNGRLENSSFDGELYLDDPNADFSFKGLIDFNDPQKPKFDFDADINKLSLKDLNLSKDNIVISGEWDINSSGTKVNDLFGFVKGEQINVIFKDSLYTLDNLDLNINKVNSGKELTIKSEAFDLNVKGVYDLEKLVPSLRKMIRDNHVDFLAHWPQNDKNISTQKFDIKANVRDSKNFFTLLGLKDVNLKNVALAGTIDTDNDELTLIGDLPRFNYGGLEIVKGKLDVQNFGKKAHVNVLVDSTDVSGTKFNPILVSAVIEGKTVDLHVTTEEFKKDIERIDLMAKIVKQEEGYIAKFDNDRLTVLGKQWTFASGNKVFFKDKYIDIDQMVISDGERNIFIDDINDHKGLKIDAKDFDFKLANDLVIKMKELAFAGTTNLNVMASNIFDIKQNSIDGHLKIEPFFINEEDYGAFSLKVNKTEKDDNIYAIANINREDYTLDANARYNTKEKYVDSKLTSKQFPLKFFKFFIGDGIHDTHGGLDIEGKLYGPTSDIVIDADVLATGGTTIDYTNGAYHFKNQKIKVTQDYIDFTGGILMDKNDSEGTITGKMHHRYFKDFNLEVNISGDDVIVLDTDETINELYYGLGKGWVSTDFSGPFNKVNMKIKCETKKGTELSIPIQSTGSDVEKSFITFIDKEELENKENNKKFKYKLDGIDIEMDVAMTPEAKVNLIFDEQKGDIIKGSGNGNLKVYITREGDFNVYGDYNVTQGEYLFTAVGFVAKPFTVRPGGLIRWTGDPFNTTLDITADYTVRAPLNVFLNEYLTRESLRNDASNRTDVNLVLKLGDKLFKPSINFDLNFPSLTGEIASITDSKMRTLQKNQNELNNQVLGLIVFNSFIPSSFVNDGLTDNALSAGISTLSEFVSSQLSIFVTGLINEALEDNGLISGIDFDIGLKKNSFYGVSSASNDVLPDEIEVNLKNKFRFLDERMSLNLGGNYVREPIITNIQEYFIGDFALEYYLTSKRNLKLRMYGKYDYDEAIADRRMRYGLGIGYNTQFDSIKELKDEINKNIKKMVKDQ